jgi:hypothetical protein
MPKGIPGTTSVGKFTVDFYEIKENDGPSPRGISVTLKDHAKSKYDFQPITPNPHENPTYNIPNNQKKFYSEAAGHIVKGFAFTADDVTIPYANLPSTKPYNAAEMNKLLANEIGKKILNAKDWTKVKSDDQKKFISDYPKKIAEFKKEKENSQATAEWAKHLKGKGGSTFSWGGVTYKLAAPAASA